MTAQRGEPARPIGRCIGCFHPFDNGPCGGCGAIEPCDGSCHEQDRDDCPRCADGLQMCDDCRAYARSNQ